MSDVTTSDARDRQEVAQRESERVKGTAGDAASNVGDHAQRRGREVADEARQHARSIAGDARSQLRRHAEEETRRAGSALGNAGTQLRALADGRPDEAGAFGEYIQQAADTVNRWAETVDDRGLDGLLDDMRGYGRRRPGMFLLGALAAGVVAGRFGRNVAPELSDDGTAGAQPSPDDGDDDDEATSDDGTARSFGAPQSGGSLDTGDGERSDTATSDTVVVDEGERPDGPATTADVDDVGYEPIDVQRDDR